MSHYVEGARSFSFLTGEVIRGKKRGGEKDAMLAIGKKTIDSLDA